MRAKFNFRYLLLVLIVCGSLSSALAGGSLYRSDDGRMSIKFPTQWDEEVSKGEQVNTYKITAKSNGQTFLVNRTVHKVDLEAGIDFAKISLDAFVDVLEGKIVSQDPISKGRHSGYDAQIEIPNTTAVVQYQVFVVQQVQYQVVFISENPDYDSKIVSRYFKSFKLKG